MRLTRYDEITNKSTSEIITAGFLRGVSDTLSLMSGQRKADKSISWSLK